MTRRLSLWTVLLAVVVAASVSHRIEAADETTNDAIKPVPRDGGWMRRHESFNKRVAEGNVDLVFIGDSITQGWEGNGKEVWKKYYGKRNAVNLGIGGDRTQHVLWRLENGNIQGIKPKAAVIMIGTNNAGPNEPAQTAAGVKAIVAKLREGLPETKLLLLAVFPRGSKPDDRLRKKNDAVNAEIAKLDDGKGVFYLDIGKGFLTDDGTLTRKIMPDLLHLSPEGYEIWAKSIEPKLSELMGESGEKKGE